MPEKFQKTVFPYWLIDRWQELFRGGGYLSNGNEIEKRRFYTIAGYDSPHDYAQSAVSYIRPIIYFEFPEAIFIVSDGKDDILELEFNA